jgi:hypothetical protein
MHLNPMKEKKSTQHVLARSLKTLHVSEEKKKTRGVCRPNVYPSCFSMRSLACILLA